MGGRKPGLQAQKWEDKAEEKRKSVNLEPKRLEEFTQPILSERKAGSWARKREKSGKLGQIAGGKREFEWEFY